MILLELSRPLFRTRITPWYPYRIETGPYFVPGLTHAHSAQAGAKERRQLFEKRLLAARPLPRPPARLVDLCLCYRTIIVMQSSKRE